MKRSVLFRLLSMLLVFAMLVELLPAGAFAAPAEEDDYLPPAQAEAVPDEPAETEGTTEAETLDPTVLGEITELREENVKHFRMEDGSNLAVSFGSQIHFKDENDTWADIDNTLALKENTSVPGMNLNDSNETKTDVYEAMNGNQVRQFAAAIEENGFLFSAKSGDSSFSLFIESREQDEAFDDDNNVEAADPTADDQQNVEEETLEEELPVEQAETADAASDDENDGEVAPAESQMDPKVEPAKEQQNDDGEFDLIDPPTAEPNSENLDQPNNAPQQYSVPAKISYPSARYAEMSEEEKQALPISEQIEPEKLAADISYSNVWPGTDILYQPYGMNVKESIILTQPKEQYEYSFRLHLDGFSATLNEDGSISLMDADGETVFEIPAPFMEDSGGALSSNVSYSLTEAQEDYVLSIWADPDWINDPNRVWPITIDPTVMYRSNSSNPNILTSYVNSDRPYATSDNNKSYLRSGYYTNTLHDENCTGHTVGLIYVNNLPEVPNGCVVTAAQLEFSQVLYGGTNNVGYHRLYATNISTPGNPTTYLNGMTWNNYISDILPHYIKPIENEPAPALDYSKEYAYAGKKTIYAITSAAKSWYDPNDSSVSRLLVLDNGHTDTTNARVTYAGYNYGASVYEPKIYVQYLNTVGIDGNSGYHTQDIGRAGTGYVNDFTLKSSLSVPLITAPSDALPFTLSAIYNEDRSNAQFTYSLSNGVHTANYSSSNLGYGWKLSVQQSICSKSLSDGSTTKTHLIYTDSDGTEHYFTKETGEAEYKDEEGLGLKITGSASSYTMKDKSGNSWIFTYGYLTEYTSSEGNKLYYAYDGTDYSSDPYVLWRPQNNTSAHRVTGVWRRNKGANAYIVAILGYSGNHLSYVKDAANRQTNFGYSNTSATTLTSIGFPDSKTVSYAYSLYNGYYRITEARDNEKGYKINYEYQGSYPLRVLRFKESVKNSSGNWIEGQKVNCYQYGANYSRFRYFDAGDTSDDGKMVTLHYFDNTGRTVNAITMNAAETEVLGVSTGTYTKNSGTNANNNRLLGAASAGVQTTNLLIDSGLESASPANYWGSSSIGSTAFVTSYNSFVPRTGNKMMKLTLSTNGKHTCYQSVHLKGGTTYVFSAYVNSLGASSFDTCETYLSFQNSTGSNYIASSGRINYYTNSAIGDGWSRLEVSYTPGTSGSYRVAAVLENYIGVVLFDDFQLEAVPNIGASDGGAGTVNVLQFGSFEKRTGSNSFSTTGVDEWWTYTSSQAVPSSAKAHTGTHSMTFAPSMSAKRRATQIVQINNKADKTYILSAWGWTPKTNLYDGKEMAGDNSNEARFFGIIAKLEYANNAYNPDYYYLSFNGDISDWQFASTMIVPKQAKEHPEAVVSKITLSAALDYCANRTYIDDVSLAVEPVQTYEYDDKGDLVMATDGEGKTLVERDDYDRIKKYTATNGVEYALHYPNNNTTTQNPDTITSDSVVTTKSYDAGLETCSHIQKTGNDLYLESTASVILEDEQQAPNSTKNFYTWVKDVNGVKTSFTYNNTKGLCLSSTSPKRTINYSYYDDNDRPNSTYQTGVANVTNHYDSKGRLQYVARKTFSGTGNSQVTTWQTYGMAYNEWGQTTQVAVSRKTSDTWSAPTTSRTLMSYEYNPSGTMKKQLYPNGDYVEYAYDNLDRTSSEVYTNQYGANRTYNYVYNASGALSKKYSSTGDVYDFEYDSLGRLIRSRQRNGNTTIQRTEHLYDSANRLTKQAWTVGNNSFSEEYTYRSSDGALSSFKAATDNKVTYTYDVLKRPSTVTTTNAAGTSTLFYTAQNYAAGASNNQTTNRISGFAYRKNGGSILNYNTYSYDSVGNITQIKQVLDGNRYRVLAKYTYDTQNQLTQEIRYSYTGDNLTGTATTINYSYDTAGNLLGSYNATGVNWVTCDYTNSNWADLLTSVNVDGTTRTISYSGSNPTNWYNGSTYSNLTWVQGRQLASLNKGSNSISYTYDMDGIRSRKVVNGATYNYITQNGKVVRETVSSSATNYTVDFIYDTAGQPFAMIYTTSGGTKTTFYYVLNAQGDVVALIDSYGTVYASYTYDAWGKVLTAQSYNNNYPYLHSVNPLRYRGYYYDTETGWYYLQSRYYDPVIKRFLNADCYASTGQGFIGCNMFAYCDNNPIINVDPFGELCGVDDAVILVSAVIIVGVYVLGSYLYSPYAQNSLNTFLNSLYNSINDSVQYFSKKIKRKTTDNITTKSVASSASPQDPDGNKKNKKQTKRSDKEKSTDHPSWVSRADVNPSQSAQQNARRLMNEKYGVGNWKTGPNSEYNMIVKWIQRDIFYYS